MDDLASIFESEKKQKREEVLAFLQRIGRIRLAEAGPNLRIYNFATFSGERIKLCLYNDGTCEIQRRQDMKKLLKDD